MWGVPDGTKHLGVLLASPPSFSLSTKLGSKTWSGVQEPWGRGDDEGGLVLGTVASLTVLRAAGSSG